MPITGDLLIGDATSRSVPWRCSGAQGRMRAGHGWPTGVEVSHAMVHGGPFPVTSDSRTTSVGTLAIRRFLRPVWCQDTPADLLPAELRDDSPARIPRLVDGARVAGNA